MRSPQGGPKRVPAVYPLADAGGLAETSGGKASVLGNLIAHGANVPPGIVVSTTAYAAALASAAVEPALSSFRAATTAPEQLRWAAEVADILTRADIPGDVEADILGGYRTLLSNGYAAAAVRSSATIEDLPESSFAGQFHTALGLINESDVLAAIRRCWASRWQERVLVYEMEHGLEVGAGAVAVIVQALIDAEVSGVMFTADPVTGDRSSTLITAGYGLGEAIVSGLVTPDTYTVRTADRRPMVTDRKVGAKRLQVVRDPRGGVREEPVVGAKTDELCLDDETLVALARVGHSLAGRMGGPVDVEWAITGGEIYVLQSRPITTSLADVSRSRQGRGPFARIQREAEAAFRDHFPLPPKDLDVDVLTSAAVLGVMDTLSWMGMRVPPTDEILRTRPDGGRDVVIPKVRPTPRAILTPLRVASRLRNDPRRHWLEVAQPALRREIEALDCPADARSPQDVVRYVAGVADLMRRFSGTRFRDYVLPNQAAQSALSKLLRIGFGRQSAEALTKLAAASGVETMVVNDALAAMARSVRPDLLARLRAIDASERWGLLLVWQDEEAVALRAKVVGFLERYGHRAIDGMVAVPSCPTWAERPDAVLGLLMALAGAPPSDEGTRKQGLVRPKVSRWKRPLKRPIKFMAQRAQGLFWAREASLATIEQLVSSVRRPLVAWGTDLQAAGVLDAGDDIFFLRVAELDDLAHADAAARASGRWRAIVEARRAVWQRLVAPEPDAAERGDVLRGQPASAGEVTGPVRVVLGPADFEHLQDGDILVCPFTTPTWTPLFAVAAAVVTETGGVLSHAAIVAREYGIPAVMGVDGATRHLKGGEIVTIDGTRGQVRVSVAPEATR